MRALRAGVSLVCSQCHLWITAWHHVDAANGLTSQGNQFWFAGSAGTPSGPQQEADFGLTLYWTRPNALPPGEFAQSFGSYGLLPSLLPHPRVTAVTKKTATAAPRALFRKYLWERTGEGCLQRLHDAKTSSIFVAKATAACCCETGLQSCGPLFQGTLSPPSPIDKWERVSEGAGSAFGLRASARARVFGFSDSRRPRAF